MPETVANSVPVSSAMRATHRLFHDEQKTTLCGELLSRHLEPRVLRHGGELPGRVDRILPRLFVRALGGDALLERTALAQGIRDHIYPAAREHPRRLPESRLGSRIMMKTHHAHSGAEAPVRERQVVRRRLDERNAGHARELPARHIQHTRRYVRARTRKTRHPSRQLCQKIARPAAYVDDAFAGARKDELRRPVRT